MTMPSLRVNDEGMSVGNLMEASVRVSLITWAHWHIFVLEHRKQ